MPKETIQTFEVKSLSILNPEGEADPNLEPNIPPKKLKKMFEDMLLTREFDFRCISLQRQGRMGTYAASLGQEAVHIGAAATLETTDWAVPCFREQGVYLSRGVKPTTFFLFFMGSEEGNRLPRELRTLPYCVPCATQILHAVGIAMAAKIKHDPIGVMTFFGDGATSEGDFHEGLNFAGVYNTPNVFVCQNNQWAISTPRALQTTCPTLAQKAIAHGLEGIQVDGNDILAVYRSCEEAMKRALALQGATFLECVTYRMEAHTTSDDPLRYRSEEEVKAWAMKDPIDRFEKYLIKKGILQKGEREAMAQGLAERLKAAAAEAEEICRSISADEMFTYMYAQMPEILKGQLQDALHQTPPSQLVGRAHGSKGS